MVPVRFHGNLKNPQADIAANTIELMLKKTAILEAQKLKNQVVDQVKAKAQEAIQGGAGGLFDQLKKSIGK